MIWVRLTYRHRSNLLLCFLSFAIVRYRAALRSNSLVAKGDTRVGYNIISGDSRSALQYPDPVAKPASLQRGPPSPRVDRRKSLQPHNDF